MANIFYYVYIFGFYSNHLSIFQFRNIIKFIDLSEGVKALKRFNDYKREKERHAEDVIPL